MFYSYLNHKKDVSTNIVLFTLFFINMMAEVAIEIDQFKKQLQSVIRYKKRENFS